MPQSWKLSRSSAFFFGVAVVIPLLGGPLIAADQFILRVLGALTLATYVACMFVFIAGPMRWQKCCWVPVDGLGPCLSRGLFWLLGAIVSGLGLRYASAI